MGSVYEYDYDSCTIFYYRPQRSWGKVIFSQACVILFTGGVGCVCAWSAEGAWSWAGCMVPGDCAWSWGTVHGPWGVCLVWGVPGPERYVVLGGYVPGRGGVCGWSRGEPGGDPPETATAAGGTHPTGCILFLFFFKKDIFTLKETKAMQ